MSKKTTSKKNDAATKTATEDKPIRKMSTTLNRYRVNYQPSLAAGGRKSLNNGDDLASLLSGLEPKGVATLAEIVLGLAKGELVAKYEHLNPGQQRMNSGNRIRAAIKRGDITIKDVQKANKKAA